MILDAAVATTVGAATIFYGVRCVLCGRKIVINDLYLFAMSCGAVVSGLAMAIEGLTSSFGSNPPKTATFMVIFGFAVSFVCGQKAYKIARGIKRKV